MNDSARRVAMVLGVSIAAGSSLLSGCAVGPDFKAPEPPGVQHYKMDAGPAELPASFPGANDAQVLVEGADIPPEWWRLLGSPAINALVAQALKNNPTMDAAQAALRQATENLAAQRGSLYPEVQAGYSLARQRNAVDTLSPTLTSGAPVFNLHTGQVTVSYLFDVFGLNRRQVETLRALADVQRFETEAAWQTLASSVTLAALEEASLREQLEATRVIARSEAETVAILHRQYDIGAVAMSDVLLQEAALAAAEAAVPPLEKQLDQQRHLLAALTGHFPAEVMEQNFRLSDLTLPAEVPLSVPSKLVAQRPDVRAAEAQLHAATAAVGVAIASMLPELTLTAGAGSVATAASDLLRSGSGFWSVGASLSQTLFAGGALYHHKRAADAVMDQAGAQYRGVVLAAFQNVADALTALDADARQLQAQVRAEGAARESFEVARRNVDLGLGSSLALLSAEQAYQQAVIGLVQARTTRYADTVALFQALGGGWWNREDSPARVVVR